MESSEAFVWPKRTRPLTALTEEQYAAWERDGFLVVPQAVPPHVCAEAAAAVREFVGADPADPDTWYRNTLDIYTERLPDGKLPAHGPCGMVQMYHHAALWAIRQHPRVHEIFADLYGTRRLYVTTDRAHFRPSESAAHPAWSEVHEVHSGLHWDVATTRDAWPVPFSIQGMA